MSVNRVVFTWERIEEDPIDYGNMNKLDIIFEKGKDKPVILIDAGNIKIEDNTFEIDSKDVLKKIREIDFNMFYNLKFRSEYSGHEWKLMVDDKIYELILEDPHYIVLIKRIIRFNAVQDYANKKLAKYIKG